MCTAINDMGTTHLFGRTLDLEYSLDEMVAVIPRNFEFSFIHQEKIHDHEAIIGTAHFEGDHPLFYDGMNESGLCVAALRFPKLCVYHDKAEHKINLASFELIPWILCKFNSAKQAHDALKDVNITQDGYSQKLPSSPLHWIVADKNDTFVIECREDGLKIYDNPYGVLANAPDFPTQCFINDKFGEPMLGDMSSSSRFIRTVNAKNCTLPAVDHTEAISRFFHILGTVNQPHGLFSADDRQLKTVYTSCMDTQNKTYYFTTYDCRTIRAVRLKSSYDLVQSFPMARGEQIEYLN